MRAWITQLRKGVVELAVLAALRHGEAYGYELLQRVNRLEGLAVTESTVYPLLARLTREGVLSTRSAASSFGPPRRYYRMTAAGLRRLRQMSEHWQQVQQAIEKLFEAPTHQRAVL
jgi:PadR family transcriptional regulator PadR